MSNLILPDDPDFKEPITWGDAYSKTPNGSAQVRAEELDKQQDQEPGNFKYASTQIAYAPDPWYKQAQVSGVSNMMTQPMWFSPLHTPQNWQIASKRREVYQWNRFWYENEPKVAAAIDFYARFPMNGFDLVCPDSKILSYFEHHVVKKLKLNERLKEISSEYYMLGDVFIHTDIKCEICGGTAVDPDTKEQCDHPGGSFGRIFVMNPDWIEVQRSPLTDEPLIVLIPDEELQQIVHKRSPKAIYDRIPEHLKPMIMARAPIPMSNRTMSHLKHMAVPYGTYGTSIIRRLFTTLAYKTKILTANWIVAERLILPVRVVKIGSDNRPASTTDIADIQTQLAQTANDPNLTIATHHNFEYEWYGAAGKILQVTQEMEHIDKELLDGLMLNQALLNGEMCIPEEDRMLTRDGFKNLDEISEDDEIATYDADRKCLEYQKPTGIHVYDYDDELTHFQTDRIDFACTPNHQMLYQKRDSDEWIVDKAENVKDRAKFVKTMKWFSGGNTRLPSGLAHLDFADEALTLKDYIKIVAYYVTEGHLQHETRKERSTYGDPTGVHIAQTEKGKAWTDLCMLQERCSTYRIKDTRYGFAIYNKKLAEHLHEYCGELSEFKHIPQHVKNLSRHLLHQLLMCLIDGDGSLRTRDKHGPKKYYNYYTKSKQLRDDVMEIALKCGYFPRFRYRRNIWELSFSDYDLGQKTIPLESKKHKTITQFPYKGKVWCVTVPNSYVITERNGKIMVSHNSGYQSAQVGVETLIRRIESWRATLAEWVEENVFKPIAEMQGFVDEKKSEEVGETVFLYPTIKWNDLELKDKTQYHQMLMQLHDKQVISTQTLLDEIGLDYDQEVKRQRYEQAQLGPAGAALGGGGAMPGMGMGGGGGAGAPGGAASPEQMGMPGMGMEPAGGMGGMGDMGGGAAAPMAAGAGGKITKKGKGKQAEEEMPIPMMPIKLTQIEQKMAGMLENVANTMGFSKDAIRMQFPVENPKGGKSFTMDFALPGLKIDIEADGEVWHSSQEQTTDDQERDYLLAQRGWTILRFDDKAIEESTQQVEATINSYITEALSKSQGSKKASLGSPSVSYFIGLNGELKDFEGNGSNYYKYLTIAYPKKP